MRWEDYTPESVNKRGNGGFANLDQGIVRGAGALSLAIDRAIQVNDPVLDRDIDGVGVVQARIGPEALRDEVGARNRIELAAWAGQNGFYAPGSIHAPDSVPVQVARSSQR